MMEGKYERVKWDSNGGGGTERGGQDPVSHLAVWIQKTEGGGGAYIYNLYWEGGGGGGVRWIQACMLCVARERIELIIEGGIIKEKAASCTK